MTQNKGKSKSAIYAENGIIYDAKTGKIFHPVLGWIAEPLVNGNDKIGKGIYHFSTLPGTIDYHVNIAFKVVESTIKSKKSANYGKTCKVNVIDNDNPVYIDVKGTCVFNCDGCYAQSGNYKYSTTIAYLAIRTWLVWNDVDFLKRAIIAQIKACKIKFVRIHASGDFASDEYIQMWIDIVTKCKNTSFWTYTKVEKAEKIFDSFENANIVHSVIEHFGFNFGHCDYILAVYKYLKSLEIPVYICRCGIDKNQHCTNCKGCSKFPFVLFIEHSTEYKAEKDILFPVLKEIIESQEKP